MPGFQLRQLSGFFHGVVEIAEAVHQAVLLRVFTRPDVTLRNLVYLLRRLVT